MRNKLQGWVTVFALLLASPAAADTYYSAKDPDIVPLPFNRHPGLPVEEIRPGVFIVDDTSIVDTPEQITSRYQRRAAAERAKAIAADPVLTKLAQEKRRVALETAWSINRKAVAPWQLQEIGMADGMLFTEEKLEKERRRTIEQLAEKLNQDYQRQRQLVDAFVATNRLGISIWALDENGRVQVVDSMEGQVPVIKGGCDIMSAYSVSAAAVWPGGGTRMNLTGTNVLIGMWDSGDVLTTHQEFTNGSRVVDIDGPSFWGVNNHACAVSGIIAAEGIDISAIGLAYRSKVLAADLNNDFGEMMPTFSTNIMRISNHSYETLTGWYFSSGQWIWRGDVAISTNEDYHFGFYEGNSQTLDSMIYTAQTYLPVWAVANERNPGDSGPASQPVAHYERTNGIFVFSTEVRPLDDASNGYDTLPGAYQVAKNNLVVGAVFQNGFDGYTGPSSVGMTIFSSFGPTDDGRIKPDIVSPGSGIRSITWQSTSSYGDNYTGTSVAAPTMVGTLGLLVELQQRLYGTNQPMWASTVRGLVIHTADEAGTADGPDYRFGWGLQNARTAALLLTNNFKSKSLAFMKEVRLLNGDYIEFPVVATNNKPLRVTICWTDPAGTPVAASLDPTNRMLVNDLDLRIIGPGGTTNYPWVLSRDFPTNAATTGDNLCDNVEQVPLPLPRTVNIWFGWRTRERSSTIWGKQATRMYLCWLLETLPNPQFSPCSRLSSRPVPIRLPCNGLQMLAALTAFNSVTTLPREHGSMPPAS